MASRAIMCRAVKEDQNAYGRALDNVRVGTVPGQRPARNHGYVAI